MTAPRVVRTIAFLHPGWLMLAAVVGIALDSFSEELARGVTINPLATPLFLLILIWTYGLGLAASDLTLSPDKRPDFRAPLTCAGAAAALAVTAFTPRPEPAFHIVVGALALIVLGALAVTIWQAAWSIGTFARAEGAGRGRSDIANALLLFFWPVGAWYFWPLTMRIRRLTAAAETSPSMQG